MAIAESEKFAFVAKALIVDVLAILIAAEYTVDAVVGVLPSVV